MRRRALTRSATNVLTNDKIVNNVSESTNATHLPAQDLSVTTSPASARRRRLPPRERTERLLDRAIEVLAKRGLGRGGHADVAALEGVAVSTVFVYFPNRAALVDAAVSEVARFYVDMAEEIHGERAPTRCLVTRHARRFAASVDSHPHYARLWLDWSTALRDDLWPQHERLQERVVQLLARTLRRGQDDGVVAADLDVRSAALHLYASAKMIVQLVLSGAPQAEIEVYLETLVGLVFR